MIKIVNYGSGNIQAIANIYKKLGIQCQVASNSAELSGATRIILPGVGAFDETMAQLEKSQMIQPLNEYVLRAAIPVLGVCVGMQIMAESSEEGSKKGLGWIAGTVRKVDTARLSRKPKLPHMGWNSIEPIRASKLFSDVDCTRGFYFLHSYCFACKNEDDILARCHYGEHFTCAIQHNNVIGTQFHPEKSHSNGISILKNFASLSLC